MPQRDVERLGWHVLRREIRHRTFETRFKRVREARQRSIRHGESAECVNQRRDLLGWYVEPEYFYGNDAIVMWVVSAKNGSKNPAADLMQHAVGTEGGRRGETGGIVEMQRRLPG